MINVKKITVFMVGLATVCSGLSAQTVERPAEWTLSNCIEYALQQNISVRKNRISAENIALIDFVAFIAFLWLKIGHNVAVSG